MKKIIAILLALTFIFALSSCGEGTNKATDGVKTEDGKTVWYLGGGNLFSLDSEAAKYFENTKDTVDPDKIYSSVTYTEKMLYGAYTLNNEKKDVKKLRKERELKSFDFTTATYEIIDLPVAVISGANYICSSQTNYNYGEWEEVTDREIAVLKFATADNIGTSVFSYEVNGNKVKYTQLVKTSEDDQPLTFKEGNAVFEYEFAFSGPYITLSNGENSMKLTAYSFTEDADADLYMSGYSLPDSPLVDGLDHFCASKLANYAARRDGSYYDVSAFKMCDDGRLTVHLADSEEDENAFSKQYAYIVISDGSNFLKSFGLILFDGEKEYYYTDSVIDREERLLSADGEFDLDDEQIEKIAEKKSDLFDDLYNEFASNGISVTINRATGEITMDSSVIFGGDSAKLTDSGKELINKFLGVYTKVIFNEKYNGFVKKTYVEGHTAPVANDTYEDGLPLSQERADNVKDYCVSAETGVDTTKLSATLESVGYSNSKPVYDANGEIDLAACRRVSFRFTVNADN